MTPKPFSSDLGPEMSGNLGRAALDYASRGWSVFPVEARGKRPLGRLAPHGLKDATTDHKIIEAWWKAQPEANIGLPTGLAFDVLDVDGDDGLLALEVERPDGADRVNGPTVTTGKGMHVYVAPTGLRNRAGVLAHVDWRGEGGYVVAPPSVHATGAVYGWYCGIEDPDFGINGPLLPVPAWLLHLVSKPPAPASGPPLPVGLNPVAAGAYGRRALEDELYKVVSAPIGQRNSTLNQAAFSLGQLVAGGVLPVDDVVSALIFAAQQVGLGQEEARKTIASGFKAGFAQPRRISA